MQMFRIIQHTQYEVLLSLRHMQGRNQIHPGLWAPVLNHNYRMCPALSVVISSAW